MLDLFDDARTELALEELRTAERVVVGVGVVAVGVRVGTSGRPLTRSPGGPGVLDRAARGGDRLGSTGRGGGPGRRRPVRRRGAAAGPLGARPAGSATAGRVTVIGGSAPGWADGSTIASMRQSWPITSIAACRRISSLPPLLNELRAPALTSAIVRVLSSTAATWAFWLSRIQV